MPSIRKNSTQMPSLVVHIEIVLGNLYNGGVEIHRVGFVL